MAPLEQERYELQRSTNFNEKQMKKLLSHIPGTGKTTKKIIQVIKSLSKIYVGQLTEEAKMIQLLEIKEEEQYYQGLYQRYQKEALEQGEDPARIPPPPAVTVGPI